MPYTALSDAQPVVAVLTTTAATAAQTAKVGWFDMGGATGATRVQFIIQVGAIGASATVDAVVNQAKDTSGTLSKALTTTKTIAQITASNKFAVVNVAGTDLDTNNGFRTVELLLTVGTATANISGVCLADPETTPPATLSGGQVVL